MDGYQFAYLAAHNASERFDNWEVPGAVWEGGNDCACGVGYGVSETGHYHDTEGVCHNTKLCAPFGLIPREPG